MSADNAPHRGVLKVALLARDEFQLPTDRHLQNMTMKFGSVYGRQKLYGYPIPSHSDVAVRLQVENCKTDRIKGQQES